MQAMLKVLTLAGAAALMAGDAAAFTRESPVRQEVAINHTGVSDIDAPSTPRRDADGSRSEVRAPFGRPVSTAIGNLISVDAGPNSTVILNALQINRGNQTAINGEVDLD